MLHQLVCFFKNVFPSSSQTRVSFYTTRLISKSHFYKISQTSLYVCFTRSVSQSFRQESFSTDAPVTFINLMFTLQLLCLHDGLCSTTCSKTRYFICGRRRVLQRTWRTWRASHLCILPVTMVGALYPSQYSKYLPIPCQSSHQIFTQPFHLVEWIFPFPSLVSTANVYPAIPFSKVNISTSQSSQYSKYLPSHSM